MSRNQHANLVGVSLWLASILLFTTAAWSGNGYAGVTGLLFFFGGCGFAHKADET